MDNPTTYLTLKSRSEGIYKEKGSKFIGIAVACYNEHEAKQFLDKWKKEHHQAGHLCYAYRFGLNKAIYRSNDDGEPSNSAGAPILGQIQSFDLSNILIGVVRYYGGTKLGVGGLINAYRTAAKGAIENGEITETEVFSHVRFEFEYEIMPEIMTWLKHLNLEYSNQDFSVNCTLDVAIPLNQRDELLNQLTNFENLRLKLLGEY